MRQPVNAPRHGPAMPSTGVSDQSDVVHVMLTLCQEKKKNAQLNAQLHLFFYSASDLHTLTLCLRDEVDPGRPYPLIIHHGSPKLSARRPKVPEGAKKMSKN
jgi:hypothetical protein